MNILLTTLVQRDMVLKNNCEILITALYTALCIHKPMTHPNKDILLLVNNKIFKFRTIIRMQTTHIFPKKLLGVTQIDTKKANDSFLKQLNLNKK